MLLNIQHANYIHHISAIIFSLFPLSKASQGDVGHAVALLTAQSTAVQDPGETQKSGTSEEVWDDQKGTVRHKMGRNTTFKY